MEPLSRRNVLLLGGVGAAAIAAGAAGLLWGKHSSPRTDGGAGLEEPDVLHSAAGQLDVHLTAAQHQARLAGHNAAVFSYNGSLPGPTLMVQPGDQINLTLENQLTQATNLHVHGLHVSPQGNSDNALISIAPGDSFAYQYQLPVEHPPGVYWYHPHRHGTVADQLFAGLYGAIIVQDPQPLPVTRERVLVISDISLARDGSVAQISPMDQMMGREGALVLVNGQRNPTLRARPHERQRWRIINACTARYLKLALDGQSLELLGLDSGRYPQPRPVDTVLLTPGNRADLLVTATSGTSILQTRAVDRGDMGPMMGGTRPGPSRPDQNKVSLATFQVSGTPAETADPIPRQPQSRDLRSETVTARRELVFAMGMGGRSGMDRDSNPSQPGMGPTMMAFTINGQVFDHKRVDITVSAGGIEEWTLSNTSPMDHPVHLHIWPMQLIEAQGQPVESVEWQDVVNVPAQGSVKVRIAFDHYVGKTVYHCHILDHEDLGMMGLLEVR